MHPSGSNQHHAKTIDPYNFYTIQSLLYSNFFQVHGIIRRSSSFNTSRIEHLYKNKVTHTEGGRSQLFEVQNKKVSQQLGIDMLICLIFSLIVKIKYPFHGFKDFQQQIFLAKFLENLTIPGGVVTILEADCPKTHKLNQLLPVTSDFHETTQIV